MRQHLPLVLAAALWTTLAVPVWAGNDTFIQSDDYKDGEEVVGKFLQDDDYKIMTEEFERNDQEFDWGWAKAQKPAKPKNLLFDVKTIKTVAIPKPQNFAGLIANNLVDPVAENAKLFAQEMGWTVVAEGEAADAELAMAIVDAKADRTYAVVAMVDPFIELEVRLTIGGEKVLLIRNQAHSNSPADASLKFMDELAKFLK